MRSFWESLEGKGKAPPNSSTYYLILGCALALTAIGIMMVLSASSVEAISEGKSPYADASSRRSSASLDSLRCMSSHGPT